MSETPYQIAPQVAALKQERANAEAYGQDDRVAAVDKQLAALGVKAKAAEERKVAAQESETSRSTAPQGRTRRPTEKD